MIRSRMSGRIFQIPQIQRRIRHTAWMVATVMGGTAVKLLRWKI